MFVYTHHGIVENTLYNNLYVCMYVCMYIWAVYMIVRCLIMIFFKKKFDSYSYDRLHPIRASKDVVAVMAVKIFILLPSFIHTYICTYIHVHAYIHT
jgi:hypothetical protein